MPERDEFVEFSRETDSPWTYRVYRYKDRWHWDLVAFGHCFRQGSEMEIARAYAEAMIAAVRAANSRTFN